MASDHCRERELVLWVYWAGYHDPTMCEAMDSNDPPRMWLAVVPDLPPGMRMRRADLIRSLVPPGRRWQGATLERRVCVLLEGKCAADARRVYFPGTEEPKG